MPNFRYYQNRLRYGSASDIAIEYRRENTDDDGAPGPTEWFNVQTWKWDAAFDPAVHLVKAFSATDDAANKSFGVPIPVADDPTAYARVRVVGVGGDVLQTIDLVTFSSSFGLVRASESL